MHHYEKEKAGLSLLYSCLIIIFAFNLLYFFFTPSLSFGLPINVLAFLIDMVFPIGAAIIFSVYVARNALSRDAQEWPPKLKLLVIMYFTGILIMMYGKGAHYMANEINPNIVYTGTDVNLSRLYFLDEYFSHFIIGIGVALVAISILFLLDRFSFRERLRFPEIVRLSALSAVSLGLIAFMFSVESHQLVPYLIFLIAFLPLFFMLIRRSRRPLCGNPIAVIIISTIIFSLLYVAVWWLVFRGLPQPTEIMQRMGRV